MSSQQPDPGQSITGPATSRASDPPPVRPSTAHPEGGILLGGPTPAAHPVAFEDPIRQLPAAVMAASAEAAAP